jgi:hypothetical protein
MRPGAADAHAERGLLLWGTTTLKADESGADECGGCAKRSDEQGAGECKNSNLHVVSLSASLAGA